MKKRLFFVLPFVFVGLLSRAQNSLAPRLWFETYLEGYYTYNSLQEKNQRTADFLYNHANHNFPDINLALVDLKYTGRRSRANAGIMAGRYVNYNLADEAWPFANIFQLNAGLQLSANKNIWIDAGVLPSHLGFESAISKSCWTLTRSLAAENSPYYETGIRLSGMSRKKKIKYGLLLLNGWQNISVLPSENNIALGTQLTYQPFKNIELSWNTYSGYDENIAADLFRNFHNFYLVFTPRGKFSFTAGFDLGLQQQYRFPEKYSKWYSPQFLVRYQLVQKLLLALRFENFTDKEAVILHSVEGNGLAVNGISGNLDLEPNRYLLIRVEARHLSATKDAFYQKYGVTKTNTAYTVAVILTIK